MENKKSKISTEKLVICGILVAFYIILTKFVSIHSGTTKIGFGFLAIFLGAYLLGPIYGGLIGAIGDLLGTLLFPLDGAYFPGFTLTAFLTGVLFGLVFKGNYHEKLKLRIGIAVVIDQLILSLFLNTFWISLISGNSTFAGLLGIRLVQVLIMIIVEPVCIFAIVKLIDRNKIMKKKAEKVESQEK